MRYHCEVCDGLGMVEDGDSGGVSECSICEGTRYVETCISRIKFGAHILHRDQLMALQSDARRIISDCGKMLVCNPPHWKSYVSQLEKTIAELETQAFDLLK